MTLFNWKFTISPTVKKFENLLAFGKVTIRSLVFWLFLESRCSLETLPARHRR